MPEDIERGLRRRLRRLLDQADRLRGFLTALKKRFPTSPVGAGR
jgi:hypothetical protein